MDEKKERKEDIEEGKSNGEKGGDTERKRREKMRDS